MSVLSTGKLTFLGSGTSQGVPVIACQCPTCQSSDPKDQRLRASVLIELPYLTFAIDAGPDFRQQMLRAKVQKLDAIFYPNQAFFAFIAAFIDQKEGVAVELELINIRLNSLIVRAGLLFLNTSAFALVNGVLKTSTLRRVEVAEFLAKFEFLGYVFEVTLRVFSGGEL